MAQRRKSNGAANTAPSTTKTAAEMQAWYEANKSRIENFDNALVAIKQLRDITKSQTRTVTAFSKDQVIDFLKNIGPNETRLRELAWY